MHCPGSQFFFLHFHLRHAKNLLQDSDFVFEILTSFQADFEVAAASWGEEFEGSEELVFVQNSWVGRVGEDGCGVTGVCDLHVQYLTSMPEQLLHTPHQELESDSFMSGVLVHAY